MSRPDPGQPTPARAPIRRSWLIGGLLVVLVVVLAGFLLRPGSGPNSAGPTRSSSPATSRSTPTSGATSGGSVDPKTGLRWVAVTALPTQARRTVELIEAGGPFPYARDGIVFGNREGLLPRERSGWYHEYTVITPGSDDLGARRIVSGGATGATVGSGLALFYSDDHYRSFRRIRIGTS